MKLETSPQYFPFGEKIESVTSHGDEKKPVAVVGVYPSAVHARWISPEAKQRVAALAVANEPEPFWTGEGAGDLIENISRRLPASAGRLEPAHLNGVSGDALDELLGSLSLDRSSVYILDLWNRYLANRAQQQAVERELSRSREAGEHQVVDLLKATSWTIRDGKISKPPEKRIPSFIEEINAADPRWVITLGAEASEALGVGRLTLNDYGTVRRGIELLGRRVNSIALAHTRQIAKHGRSSTEWFETHQDWLSGGAETCAKEIAADL